MPSDTALALRTSPPKDTLPPARAAFSDVHFHRFRSTFAIYMLGKTNSDMQAVKEMLFHESITFHCR